MNSPTSSVRLDLFRKNAKIRDRSRAWELAWLLAQALLVSSWQPSCWIRLRALKFFGAEIGRGVILKPGLKVKFPWKLIVGDHSWIGEDVWIDNLAVVEIGSHCCLSQGSYLCTGNHDWRKTSFDLMVSPILVEDGAWLGAFSRVAPGVVVGTNSVLALGSVATESLLSSKIYQGNPATVIGTRKVVDELS